MGSNPTFGTHPPGTLDDTATTMRLGLITAGADCPGLNAAIRAVVGRAAQGGHTVVGIMSGWAGLLALDARVLSETTVRDILPLGGTILGAGRLNPAKEGDERLDEVIAAVGALELDGLIVIGDCVGLGAALAAAQRGVNVIGVPGTMDNDVGGTEYCIGYISAVSTVAEAIDKLHTTASAHHRVMVVEAMGREAGWVALAGAICGSAHIVVAPEVPANIEDVVARLRRRHDAGHTFSIVVVAEGASIDGLPPRDVPPANSIAARLARPGVGDLVGLEIEARTGFETRVTVLGHLQRGGSPTVYDRLMATRFGAAAVDLASERRWGHMVALQGNAVVAAPLRDAVERRAADLELYRLATLF